MILSDNRLLIVFPISGCISVKSVNGLNILDKPKQRYFGAKPNRKFASKIRIYKVPLPVSLF